MPGEDVALHIGITVCIDPGKRLRQGVEYVYLNRAYPRQVKRSGAIPILLSADVDPEDAAGLCDAVVISGGGDLPRRLQTPHETPLGEPEHEDRITWERALIDRMVAARKPVLGVCYGMQLLNLHFGGTLLRSIAHEIPNSCQHGGQNGHATHRLTRSAESQLLAYLPQEFESNSAHGQAVASLAPGFLATARAPDQVIEAIESPERQLYGVEWHPETDATGDAVYGRFLELVRRNTTTVPGAAP